MSSQVQLYVYDLTNGMARQLSRQLTGRQIDGIWHTSVVVFGREIFYGQGIHITAPGQSHHGRPMRVVDMGETALDQETFEEYLAEMRSHYTADKYHLLDFNCNSFTEDCVGFLTGGSIPSYIKDLPADFLSTPFGQALRPTIDAMFRRGPTAAPPPSSATATPTSSKPNDITSLTSPIHIITNPTSFNAFLKSNCACVVFFTSATCGPCRMIEPTFERLAEEKSGSSVSPSSIPLYLSSPSSSTSQQQQLVTKPGAAFAKVDFDVGMASQVGAQFSVRATPTFLFFVDGVRKVEWDVKGVDVAGLRSGVDLVLFEVYRPHPHTGLRLPAIQGISLDAITFGAVPPFDAVLGKLEKTILDSDSAKWAGEGVKKEDAVKVLKEQVGVYLKARFGGPNVAVRVEVKAQEGMVREWARVTRAVVGCVPVEGLFPLVDMWRVGFLDAEVGKCVMGMGSKEGSPIGAFLPLAIRAVDSEAVGSESSKGLRNYLLTVLRMVCNVFASGEAVGRRCVIEEGGVREGVTRVVVGGMLHEDATVRSAAASVGFDMACVVQRVRVERVRAGVGICVEAEEGYGDWEVEMVSALVEALGREGEGEEVVHRLCAALAMFVRLSPWYESEVKGLLEVLQAKSVLEGIGGRLGPGKVRGLVLEVAVQLC